MNGALLSLASGGGPDLLRLFIVHTFGFILVVVVIKLFVWKHLVTFFRGRREGIRETIEKGEKDVEATRGTIGEVTGKLKTIGAESKVRMDAADKEARATCDGMMDEARDGARRIGERAQREAVLEKEKALLELKQESIRLTLIAAERVVDRTMDDATHQAMVDGYIADMDKATHK
ncbi:MAG: F0F1 ATP synthase subunit B [Planctomycetota bacterium]|jgi:F-type H+-transporting ATPase subunit b